MDLSRVLAGPFCSMLLGDLGADVIKVERPGTGDETRGWGPPFDQRGESAYYLSINRNKLSVAADFRIPDDRELLRSLIASADVVIDNFLPGALARAGTDVERCLAENERLIWCTISGFEPESTRPGYDFVVQAEYGWMAISGEPGGEPMKAGIALADLVAGRDAAISILAALVGRNSGQQPAAVRHIRTSLAASAAASLVNVAQNVLVSGKDASRWGNAHANLVPYQLFRARDRDLVIAVGSDAQWVLCARVLGLEALATDPELTSNAGRIAHRDRIVTEFQGVLGSRDAADWVERLTREGVPSGIVRTVREVVDSVAGASPLNGMPSSVADPRRSQRLPPPRLDEHGALVRRLGWRAFEGIGGAGGEEPLEGQ